MVESTATLGVKDAQKSLFEIWTEILQVPPSRKLVYVIKTNTIKNVCLITIEHN
jgi:hypothetical protein